MEFIIEELSSSNVVKSQRSPQLVLRLLRVFFYRCQCCYQWFQQFFRGLSIKGEIVLFTTLVSIIVIGLIGRDIWQVEQQKLQIRKLQGSIRALSFEQQALQNTARPFIDNIQLHWITQREENSRELFSLLTLLSSQFSQQLQFNQLQKKARDPAFYLEGVAQDFSVAFQLESFLQSLKWQSVMTLLSDEGSQPFQLKAVPLHRMVLNP